LLGRRGERAAARYLSRQHYHILIRNYRCVAGEIDLICSEGDTIVFVEVKARTSDEAQDPQEAPRKSQWRRIESAARYFLMQRGAEDRPCRFDLVTVVWPPRGSPQIEHFEDAYQPAHP
jgi:putative endonuclease